jgi:hypothetical protein
MLRGMLALRLAHGFQNAQLWHAAEIGIDRRHPTGCRHVEVDGAGQLITVGKASGRLLQLAFATFTVGEAQWANKAAWLLSKAIGRNRAT